MPSRALIASVSLAVTRRHSCLTPWPPPDYWLSAASWSAGKRPSAPLIIASTLLVPGYITAKEVKRIAQFIAEYDPDIPYSLLGFAPNYLMPDMPYTSVDQAEAAYEAATAAGLTNVHIGNRHLLGYA
ncbi:MAG TPA: hypothetical protein VLE70_03110 [Anaerolineae bacterium]|nr:hypothetical protein [Anaerolineae bacterium]